MQQNLQINLFMTNKKFLTIAIIILFFSTNLIAGKVNIKDAQKVALKVYTEKTTQQQLNYKNLSITKEYIEKYQNEAVYYIFNINTNGFVIVSADDKFYPILGFSFDGNYDPNQQAPAFSNLMESYKNSIIQLRNSKAATNKKTKDAWKYYLSNSTKKSNTKEKNVPPLIKSKWNQGTHYNEMCPAHSGGTNGHCVTGCIATAMAQIMYYYKFPEKGFGSHSYYHPYYVSISADFGSTTYQWSKMTNTINASSTNAIAELMFHCGVASNMYYAPSASSSSSSAAINGLKQYFNYSNRAKLTNKSNTPDSIWNEMLIADLDDAKPILYRGSGSAGGHAFVCDGYYGADKFHFNWGWGGYNDGYFLINNIDFSSGMGAIFDLVPYDHPYCSNGKTLTSTSSTFDDGSGPSKYWNNSDCEWLISPSNGKPITLNFYQFNTESGKDFITIYNGDNTSAPVLGTFSGSTLPPVLVSTGSKMLIRFTTDDQNNDFGWTIAYTSIVAGLETEKNIENVEIFPNPAHSILNIELTLNKPTNTIINILDLSGKIIYSETKYNPVGKINNSINVSSLSKGIYFLRIVSDNSVINKKVIIE